MHRAFAESRVLPTEASLLPAWTADTMKGTREPPPTTSTDEGLNPASIPSAMTPATRSST